MEEFRTFKNKTIKAAYELCYEDKYIEKLKKATTESELLQIMTQARLDSKDESWKLKKLKLSASRK